MQRWQYPSYHSILETLILSKMWKIWCFIWIEKCKLSGSKRDYFFKFLRCFYKQDIRKSLLQIARKWIFNETKTLMYNSKVPLWIGHCNLSFKYLMLPGLYKYLAYRNFSRSASFIFFSRWGCIHSWGLKVKTPLKSKDFTDPCVWGGQ